MMRQMGRNLWLFAGSFGNAQWVPSPYMDLFPIPDLGISAGNTVAPDIRHGRTLNSGPRCPCSTIDQLHLDLGNLTMLRARASRHPARFWRITGQYASFLFGSPWLFFP
jgi:hypothetical protein